MRRGFGGVLSSDLAMDLGTANTLIAAKGRGVVLNEPSLVAYHRDTGRPIASGIEAREIFGRTPANIAVIRPLKSGVISDFTHASAMIRSFLKKAMNRFHLLKPRVVIGVPSGITQVEKRAVIDAAHCAGVRQVKLVEEPMAAALGAGLPVSEPVGSMIVDIGGGTTEVAILCLGGTVYSRSIRVAGDEMDEAIQRYLRRHFGLEIGLSEAERLKREIGSAYPETHPNTGDQLIRTSGRNIRTGLPQQANVSEEVIRDALAEPILAIIDSVNTALEQSNPEIAHDIMTRGVYLAGGGALTRGLTERLHHDTRLAFHRADDPLTCVVRGVSQVMEELPTHANLCIT
ncbi:rod shape-determining protein [bacterium]|nr:rod shape-determining protein [bacterium]